MNCPRCGAQITFGAAWCPRCSLPLTHPAPQYQQAPPRRSPLAWLGLSIAVLFVAVLVIGAIAKSASDAGASPSPTEAPTAASTAERSGPSRRPARLGPARLRLCGRRPGPCGSPYQVGGRGDRFIRYGVAHDGVVQTFNRGGVYGRGAHGAGTIPGGTRPAEIGRRRGGRTTRLRRCRLHSRSHEQVGGSQSRRVRDRERFGGCRH